MGRPSRGTGFHDAGCASKRTPVRKTGLVADDALGAQVRSTGGLTEGHHFLVHTSIVGHDATESSMSKVDQLRAMREARYEAMQKGSKPQTPVEKRLAAEAALGRALAPKPEVTQECGHQGIGGKRCIRQAGHTERNHKYGKVEKPAVEPPSAAEE